MDYSPKKDKSVLDVSVSYFDTCYSVLPQPFNLLDWLKNDDLMEAVQMIRDEKNEDMQKELKKCLPAVTVSGRFTERSKTGLIQHSGLMSIDIDKKQNMQIKNFSTLKKELSKISYVAYAGTSVSGKGYFVIIPLSHPERHGEHFEALKINFAMIGITIDESCRDVSRLRIYNGDADGYFNHNALDYPHCIKRESKISVQVSEHALNKPAPPKYSKHRERVEQAVKKIIAGKHDITSDYQNWIRIGFGFVNEFGEGGRRYFHEVSQFHPRYSRLEADFQFNKCLRYNNGTISINSFFYLCKSEGII